MLQNIVDIETKPESSIQIKGMYTKTPQKTKQVTISLDSSLQNIEEENKKKTAQLSDKQLRQQKLQDRLKALNERQQKAKKRLASGDLLAGLAEKAAKREQEQHEIVE